MKAGITPNRVTCQSCQEDIIAMNVSRRRKLGVLERRVQHLQSLGPRPGQSFDLQELGALKFAIATIKAHYPDSAQQ